MTAIAELAVAEAVRDDIEYEVVNGIKEAKMAGARHGGVTARLMVEIGIYLKTNKLGSIYTPDTTFQIGDYERLPDISFVAAERIPEAGEPQGAWRLAPDLAVEVISPTDLHRNIQTKLRDYFAAGVREVWLVEPEFKTVTVYQSPTRNTILTEDEELTSTVLPGFRCDLREIFAVPTKA